MAKTLLSFCSTQIEHSTLYSFGEEDTAAHSTSILASLVLTPVEARCAWTVILCLELEAPHIYLELVVVGVLLSLETASRLSFV